MRGTRAKWLDKRFRALQDGTRTLKLWKAIKREWARHKTTKQLNEERS